MNVTRNKLFGISCARCYNVVVPFVLSYVNKSAAGKHNTPPRNITAKNILLTFMS